MSIISQLFPGKSIAAAQADDPNGIFNDTQPSGAVSSIIKGANLITSMVSSGVAIASSIVTAIESRHKKTSPIEERNSINPYQIVYGQKRIDNPTLVYSNSWGENNNIVDLVYVVAANPCSSIDAIYLDDERIPINTNAVPNYGATFGCETISGTNQIVSNQNYNIIGCSRQNDIQTIWCERNIPYLTSGDNILIQGFPTTLSGVFTADFNGQFVVSEIVNQIAKGAINAFSLTSFGSGYIPGICPLIGAGSVGVGLYGGTGSGAQIQIQTIDSSTGAISAFTLSNVGNSYTAGDTLYVKQVIGSNINTSAIFTVNTVESDGGITFTVLNGGSPLTYTTAGLSNCSAKTMWNTNYQDQVVYVESILGNQAQGQSFAGMLWGTPWLGNCCQLVTQQFPNGYYIPEDVSLIGTEFGCGAVAASMFLAMAAAGPLGLVGDALILAVGAALSEMGCTWAYGGDPGPGSNGINTQPWTNNCSLLGKTAVFVRLTCNHGAHSYNFNHSIPRFSFLVSGYNQVTDPRNANNPIGFSGSTNSGTTGVSALDIVSGTGYSIGQTVTLNGGANCQVHMDAVDGNGKPIAVRIWNAGNSYTTGQVTDNTGNAVWNIMSVGCTAGVGQCTVVNGGTGYHQGDLLTVIQFSGITGEIVVTAVNAAGTIQPNGVIPNPVAGGAGIGYYTASNLTTFGGTGSGCTVNILTTVASNFTNASGTVATYTQNPALIIADYLCNKTWGYGIDFQTEIDLNVLQQSAYTCDAPIDVFTPSGLTQKTEPLYQCNGSFTLNQDRGEILEQLLKSMNGYITYLNGQYQIWAGVWCVNPWISTGTGLQTPNYVIQSYDLQANAIGPITWKSSQPITNLVNGCKGVFTSPDNRYQRTTIPPYAQDSVHNYSGGSQYQGDINLEWDTCNNSLPQDRRWLEIDLQFVNSNRQAQMIAKQELLKRRFSGGNTRGIGSARFNLSAYQFQPLDVLAANWAAMSWSGHQVEIVSLRLVIDKDTNGVPVLCVDLQFQETDSSIYAWNVNEELSPQGYQQSIFPMNLTVETDPYIWSPACTAPGTGDAIPGPASFGIQPIYGFDTQNNPLITVNLSGQPPINLLDNELDPPVIICEPVSTGGYLTSGTYIVGLSALDSNAILTDYNGLQSVLIPFGITTGSIVVTGPVNNSIQWGSGNIGGVLYVGKTNADGSCQMFKNQTVSTNATSAIITNFYQNTAGGPDTVFDHYEAVWQEICHSGVWPAEVVSVSGNIITFYGSGMTSNQWAGYTLSLLAQYDPSGLQPILNMPVVSSTASTGGTPQTFTVTIGTSGLTSQLTYTSNPYVGGDLLVMRYKATFTANGFSDANIMNGYYPGGDTGNRNGCYAMMLSGADIGDVVPIISNTTISYTLAQKWRIQPSTGDIVIILYPNTTSNSSVMSKYVGCSNTTTQATFTGNNAVIVSPSMNNFVGQTYLFQVRTEDQNNNHAPDNYTPFRELYVWGIGGTQTLGPSVTDLVINEDPTVGRYECDISECNITITLLPGSNRPLTVSVINTSTIIPPFTCTINCSSGDIAYLGGSSTSSVVLEIIGDWCVRS